VRYLRVWDDGPDPGVILIPVDPTPTPGEVVIDTSDLVGGDTERIPAADMRALAELAEIIALADEQQKGNL
jgi:hypothetical protein